MRPSVQAPAVGERARLLCLLPAATGGGAERVMMYLLRGLSRERFRLTLALGEARGPFLSMIPDDVEVIDLGQGSALRAVPGLARLMSERRFDVAFSMMAMNLAAVLARGLARSRLPLVLGARNHYSRSMAAEARLGGLKMQAVRWLYPRADAVVSVSDGVRQDLVDAFGLPAEKALVIRNPVDLERIASLAEEDPKHPWLANGHDVPVLIAVGELKQAKGYGDLVAAFAEVRARRAARLLILGKGPERERIEADVAARQLAEDVQLLGFQDNPYAYLARADMFVHAAHWEGFPNVVLEAMALGLPVVCTDCPAGPSEIIDSGRNGILVPVGQPAIFAEAVLAALEDNAGLKTEARRRAHDFALPAIVDRYADVFERLGGAGARHQPAAARV